ncbi:hypothetical protein FK535_05275 [Mycolicibacterium sp. 018/SC-01/001]|uniref:hypothetical protein n=1 Tax=Mycolicibacterium sp. 018/SC-01/001 TaxID=2592069 RepID=UPI00117D2C55|nr:hypothetical protein [Mycolicibacterium sp. 018/SC-01/001]TRW87854.1 hypothetical protein FK535_05275 [Mycolicibacterium sp. 018/SC-01/001]
MTRIVAAGVVLVVAVEVLAFALADRAVVVAVTGAALAAALLWIRWHLTRRVDADADNAGDATSTSLQRWLSRTETLISWADSTRADWDRRLRPMLARQFELAVGSRTRGGRDSIDATGRMLFGEHLWSWVDPDNISRTGATEPGPGREVLDEILQRLARL